MAAAQINVSSSENVGIRVMRLMRALEQTVCRENRRGLRDAFDAM
jgi:hypothetical protein